MNTDTLEDTVNVLDFEHTPTCEAPRCHTTATEMSINNCCGNSHYFCRQCAALVRATYFALILNHTRLACVACDTIDPEFRWVNV